VHRLVDDLNRHLLELDDEDQHQQLVLVVRYIGSMNEGRGLGFFLFNCKMSTGLVKGAVSAIVVVALFIAARSNARTS